MTMTVGKTGRVRLTGRDLTRLRKACFERDRYRCVVCGNTVLWAGSMSRRGHMAHIVSRGAGGSDVLENVQTKCAEHHWSEHNPKAVPAKVRR